MPPRDDMDLYEQDSYDQDPRESDDAEDKAAYKTFLAPKSSFSGKDLDVGSVHRVKIVRSLDEELELRCIEKKDDDEDNDSDLYE